MEELREQTHAKMLADMAQAEAEAKAAQEASAAEQARATEEARIAREQANAAALELRKQAEAEHKAELEARRKKDAEQALAHKREMLARKEAFEARFKHVWGSTATGVSVVDVTFPEEHVADYVIKSAFKNTLAAESHENIEVTRYTHTCLSCSRATNTVVQPMRVQVKFITSDDRVAELVEKCIEKSEDESLNVVVN